MKILSSGWAGYSKICHHTLLVQSLSTLRLDRRIRYVIATLALEYLLIWSSRAYPDCLLQEDITKFVSDPTPPPQFVDIPEEGKGKERREVGEGDDTVTIEDTSDEEDGETL
jgi:hypothetical protein